MVTRSGSFDKYIPKHGITLSLPFWDTNSGQQFITAHNHEYQTRKAQGDVCRTLLQLVYEGEESFVRNQM